MLVQTYLLYLGGSNRSTLPLYPFPKNDLNRHPVYNII